VIKLVVKTQGEGQFDTIATREYDEAQFTVPEPRNVLTIPDVDGEEDTFWIVQNVIHHLGPDQPEVHLVVQDQEAMIREMREQRARMAQLQQLAGAAGGGGANGSAAGGNKLWTPGG
jgi:hypothetical protein